MVMLATDIGLSPEFEELKQKLNKARNRYLELIEKYSELVNIIGPNLENDYMIKLGGKEHQLFSCQVEILRLKREISLFQAAVSHGRTITEKEVADHIEKEFAEYRKKIQEQTEKLKQAREYVAAPELSPEDSKMLKKLYREIVRKLHPDLNPDLPPGAGKLWEQVQSAYKNGLLPELFLLSDMVEELLRGKSDFVETINSMEQIKQELAKTKEKITNLDKQIKDTLNSVPFTYRDLLSNATEVMLKRDNLDRQIEQCQKYIAELKEIRAQY